MRRKENNKHRERERERRLTCREEKRRGGAGEREEARL